ncbi:MAG: MFS transporter [Rhodospirillaceae bacterium]|nr:MFS transporter [Rhodospirillaceae bacterium]
MTSATEFRHGWRVVLASSTGNGSGLSGLAFYTFGVFIVPLVGAFGWSRGQVSVAASFLLIGTAITAPIIGSLIDRLGTRRVAVASMAGLVVGYCLLTQLGGSITAFYAAWLAMALIGGGTTPVVWTRAVNMWFDKGRGLALGLTLAGSGIAGVLGPPAATKLITTYGWQAGYLGIAAFIALIAIPVIAFNLAERRPATSGAPTTETGTSKSAAPTSAADVPGLTLQESLYTVSFWKICGGFFFVAAMVAGLIINLVPLLIDRGLSQMAAAEIAGVMGFAVLAGRIGVGYLLDLVPANIVSRVLLGLPGLGCLLLSIDGAPTWMVLISVMSLGFAAAAEIDLVAYLVSRCFGMKSYGKIYGWQLTPFYIGAAVGPLIVGMMYDAFQGYVEALYVSAVALLVGAFVIGSVKIPPEYDRKGH